MLEYILLGLILNKLNMLNGWILVLYIGVLVEEFVFYIIKKIEDDDF